MFAVYLLLPLLASVTLAAPTQNQVDLEPRQRRPGGHRGSHVRPGPTQVAAITAAAAPIAPAPSASAPSPAPVADAPAGTDVVSPNPVVPSTYAAPDVSDVATAEDLPVSNPPAESGAADTPADPTSAAVTGAAASSPAAIASASGATSTSSSGSGAAGSGPVGIGWDNAKNPGAISSYVDAGLQWWTNWLPQADEYPAIEYVPMVWGSGSVPQLKTAMEGWPSGTKYVLSFNEPDMDHDGGSAMVAADAAKLHNEAVTILGDGYQVGAPAVADHAEGEVWLDAWLAACETAGGCKHDFLPYHFYGKDAERLIAYTKHFSEKYKKPLWLTEWACHDFPSKQDCTAAEAETFMKTIIEFFRGEGAGMVTRWAWFGAFPDMTNWNGNNMDGNRIANADGSINALGKEYMKL